MSAPYAVIETVGFGVANDEDNEREAVVELTGYELFSGANPVTGGSYDPRMGTTDHHYGCATCGSQRQDDPGHPGLVRSRVPLESPLFIGEIRKWLRIICLKCGGLSDQAVTKNAKSLDAAAKVTTDKAVCSACQAPHPKIVKTDDDHFSFEAHYPPPRPGAPVHAVKLYPSMIREIFDRVTDSTTRTLNSAYHPSALILRNIIVPPNTIRPGTRVGYGPSGAATHHDLTNMVQYLVKRNLMLPEEPPAEVSKDLDRLIQNARQLYYDMILGAAGTNASNKSTGRRGIVVGNRGVQSVVRGLSRKKGRIRRQLLGKRVWNISRSTISGNPHLRIDEVGFPVAFARKLQVEETVQEFNRDRLMVHFLNGDRQYPGCTRVIKRGSGAVHRVSGLRRDFNLEIGDRILRDVVTGDYGFFNRAPSLERSSIGVHRIVVLNDPAIQTFQFNVLACSLYNADFDGDQMNLWIARMAMTLVEAKYISSIANWFISTKTSGPSMGQVQDSVVGSFELTRSGVTVDKYHAMSLFAPSGVTLPDFSAAPPGHTYTGREVASLLFKMAPVNFSRPPSWYQESLSAFVEYDPQETLTVMRRGELVSGVLDKASIGSGSGSIFHLIAREYGSRRALDMIFALQQVSLAYATANGFTVSLSDMVVPESSLEEIHRIISGLVGESGLITQRLTRGELVPPIGMTTNEYYEALQREALKMPDSLLRPVTASLRHDTNGLFRMIACGSKGALPNEMQIAGCVGSIELNGKRIEENLSFRRSLVYYERFASNPIARGFVPNSFVAGMTSTGCIAAGMNGRFDLINKALSTAMTGYANRKAVMCLQSAIVDNLRRLSMGQRVVQLLYGGDGLDPRRVERVEFRSVLKDDDALAEAFGGNAASLAAIRADRDWYRQTFLRGEDSKFSVPMSTTRLVPVNVARLVRDVEIARGGEAVAGHSADALSKMITEVEECCEALPYVFTNEIQARLKAPIPHHHKVATRLVSMLLRIELSPPVLAKISRAELTHILSLVKLGYAQALIDYGTAAGILAAQAVSEPLTQYMLDSHHRSVAGGTNKSGIIRPAEIFGAKPVSKERSPEMFLRLRPEYEFDRGEAHQIANQIELMALSRFVRSWDLLVEPFAAPTYPAFAAADARWLADFPRHHPLLLPPSDLTNWCLRLELDKPAMILKGVDLDTIVERVRAKHPYVYLVHSPENVPDIVMRLYFNASRFRRGIGEDKVLEAVTRDVLPTIIRGVPGILSARVVEAQRHVAGPNGALKLATVYAIHTSGTNICGVLANRRIDPLRIVSSSIGDTEKVFGIYAARSVIESETERFMGGNTPNYRHLGVYSNAMTCTGKVTPLERAGIDVREPRNPFLGMSMSAPAQVLPKAAINGTAGRLYGVAAYQILGSTPPIGTLWNGFSMDEDYVRKHRRSVDAVLDEL